MKKEEALKAAEELFFEEFYKEEKDGTEIVSYITLYQDIQIMKMDIKKLDGCEDYPPHFIVALPTPNNTKMLPEWGNALISDAYGTFEGSGIPVFDKLHGALMFIDFYKPFIKEKSPMDKVISYLERRRKALEGISNEQRVAIREEWNKLENDSVEWIDFLEKKCFELKNQNKNGKSCI